MIPTLEQLRRDVHTRVNDLRRIDAIINEEAFREMWCSFSDDTKLSISNAVTWIDKTILINIIKQVNTAELGDKNVVQLRLLAKKRGIVAYMQMSKSTLLSEVSKLEGLNYDEE